MVKIWYRLNTMGEKELFSYNSLIDGIIIPAHFAAFYDPSLSTFLSDVNLPFLIDPMTYVCDSSNNLFANKKKSYQKYFEKLKIDPSIFDLKLIKTMSDGQLEVFIDKFLDFQYNITSSETPRKKSLNRIRSFDKKSSIEKKKPETLIPPYFHFKMLNDEIYNLNLKISKVASENMKYGSTGISPCLCFSKNILSQRSACEKIIDDYSFSKQIILWIDSFDDRKVDQNALIYLRDFVESFSLKGIKILNLYGSYFSVVLGYFGLNTFSSGICISHKKGVESKPTGGGQPLRYYEPTLKIEITNEDAFRLYSEYPHMFVCDCPICLSHSEKIKEIESKSEVVKILTPFFIDQKITFDKTIKAKMDWKNTRIHFLHVRNKEIEEQKIVDKYTLKKKLERDYLYLSSINLEFIRTINSPDYIRRWYTTII